VPVITSAARRRLAQRDVPRGRRSSCGLARPSLPALVGLVGVLAVFLGLAPDLLTSAAGRACSTARPVGHRRVRVALLLIAGQFDLSIGVVAGRSSLVTALLVRPAGPRGRRCWPRSAARWLVGCSTASWS
jgi:simple sugar transport system permease protein